MNTQKSLTISPTQSVLSNSPHNIGEIRKGRLGAFQVQWFPALDEHALLYCPHDRPDHARILATHHNGHSVEALARRIHFGECVSALASFDDILNCGGMGIKREHMEEIISANI